MQQSELREVLYHQVPDPAATVLYVCHSDGRKRAAVVHTKPQDFEAAWQTIVAYVGDLTDQERKYLRVDLVTKVVKKPTAEAVAEIAAVPRINYFRKGIAFDGDFGLAFLAEEVQGNALVRPEPGVQGGKNGAGMTLHAGNLSGYLYRMTGQKIDFDPAQYTELYFFETSGFFLDEDQWRPLAVDDGHSGVRYYHEEQLGQVLPEIIEDGRNFLAQQLTSEGYFVYGYFPTYDAQISGYNTIRHLSSLYAWLEVEAFRPTTDGLQQIKKGLNWALASLTKQKEDQLLFVEYLGDRQWPSQSSQPPEAYHFKLGAQAMALLALSKYMAVTGSDDYVKEVQMIAKGIQQHFVDQEGNTTHILQEDLTVKKAFEIVYYDGEAVFGLLRAYGVTKEPALLQLAQRLFDRLIAKGYQRFHDHWLSYAANEILLYVNDETYYAFGLRNALDNLTFIEQRDTAYPTMLELLMAAVKMTDKLQQQPFAQELLTSQERQRLQAAARQRALHEVNTGVLYPELGMYFKAPDKVIGGFMTRHDKFRMRIDDQEHFLSGLVNFYEYFYGK